MSNTHTYQVKVSWKSNRNGRITSDALDETLRVATPPEFPKGEANVWSPEHYFLAAVNGCLMTTFLAIAENFKLDFVNFVSDSTGILEIVDRKYEITEVILKPKIFIRSESDKALALKVIEKSEKACLISNSIRSKITLNPIISIA